ncbi:3-dehydroquinate synthase [Nocardioides coralli]|uniref:3-dehydroquinate synthase n=1 Tax=Nocardioides coralli TaxID=2872154 RepID=UPI001CA3EABB|nr:3-dehydroquinate synthase [Nocardioides coralli]QZY30503.1 3-dehydroquinate synthase [Nocardioides coralli]
MSETVMHVAGTSPYDVVVGRDLLDRLPSLLGGGVERVAVVHAEPQTDHARPVVEALAPHVEVLAVPVPDGEAAKTAEVAQRCWELLGEHGFTRSDAVVTVGGGAVTDLGGFVAATWLRGVRVVHVPTTLLGMVDAAVGGKTGINTAAGKNLVGSFHEPGGVLCDLATLDTLPPADLAAGLAEVVKCGFIADPAILELVEEHEPGDLTPHGPVVRELVERAVRVKVDVVTADLRETGGSGGHPGREVLNYGHTLGHAIERHEGYRMRHGDAVAVGCVYAAELAGRAGVLAPEVVARHRDVLARVGLPTSYDAASFEELHATMKVDKKARGSRLRFVVLRGLADPVILEGPSEEHLRAAYDAIAGGAA